MEDMGYEKQALQYNKKGDGIMLIWRGKGWWVFFLVPGAIAIGGVPGALIQIIPLTVGFVSVVFHIIGLTISAAGIALAGRWVINLGRRHNAYENIHTAFFIPIQGWGYLVMIFGVLSWFMGIGNLVFA